MSSRRAAAGVAVGFVLFTLAAGGVKAQPEAVETQTVAVLTFDVQKGVTPDEAAILADRLAIELDRTGRFTLINRQRMVELLELQNYSRLSSCSASECAVEAGRILNATYMVFGSIGKVGGTFSLNTYLIEVGTGATIQTASTDIGGGIEDLLTKGMAENAAALVAARQQGGPAKATCAVLTFDSRGGVSADEVRLFSDRFAIELDALHCYTLVPRSKMEEVLAEGNFVRSEDCSAAECAVEAGKLLGVQYMAFGSIGVIGSLYTINTYLVNVESGAAEKTATTDFRGDKESVLTQGMRLNALTLTGMQEQQGYLEILLRPAEASLFLDGQSVRAGRAPVSPTVAHQLEATAPGYKPWAGTQAVKPGETARVEINLVAIPAARPAVSTYKPRDPSQKPPVRPRVH